MYYDAAAGPICVNISLCVRVGQLYYFYTCICVFLLDFIVFVILRGGVGYLGSIYI